MTPHPTPSLPSGEVGELVNRLTRAAYNPALLMDNSESPTDRSVLLREAAAALAASEAERERMRGAAAALCDKEADERFERAKHPLPGDETIGPFTQSMVQESKGITARLLANAIRELDSTP